ncbi:unnamed protein product, partial [Fusarium fujikuroi]
TPNRVACQYRRMRTLGNNQRSGSFLQYISSVEDLSRAIAGVQPTDPPEHGNRRLIASRASRIRSIFRNRHVQASAISSTDQQGDCPSSGTDARAFSAEYGFTGQYR